MGDVGHLDDGSYLFLCDCKIDMIISGGANIYPTEVEGCLLSHPKVGDAAVFGIPDDDWGEQVNAVIEPAPGVTASPTLANEILAFCTERIAKFKCPKSIDFIPELPRRRPATSGGCGPSRWPQQLHRILGALPSCLALGDATQVRDSVVCPCIRQLKEEAFEIVLVTKW